MINDSLFSIVLAAGTSSRFGAPKQLATYRGHSLVRRATRLACKLTGSNTVLVVGAHWQSVSEECMPFAGVIARNEDYESGLGSSLACGMNSIPPEAYAVLIMLADQPLITLMHLQTLAASWRESAGSIVASEYAGVSGAPVIFPARHFSSLQNLSGDQGARSIITDNKADLITISFDDAAVDIDTPDDLQNLR